MLTTIPKRWSVLLLFCCVFYTKKNTFQNVLYAFCFEVKNSKVFCRKNLSKRFLVHQRKKWCFRTNGFHLNILCLWPQSNVTKLIWRFRNNFTSSTRNSLEIFASNITILRTTNKIFRPLYIYHHNVQPKGRSFTENSGTQAAVLLKAGLPLQTPEPCCSFTRDCIGTIASVAFRISLSLQHLNKP